MRKRTCRVRGGGVCNYGGMRRNDEGPQLFICCFGRLSVCLLFLSLKYDLSSEQQRICRRMRRSIVVHLLPGAVVCLHRPTCVSVIQTAYVHSLIHPLLMFVLMRILKFSLSSAHVLHGRETLTAKSDLWCPRCIEGGWGHRFQTLSEIFLLLPLFAT